MIIFFKNKVTDYMSHKRDREVTNILRPDDIQVKVTYTEGYEKRFTQCCLEQLNKRHSNASEKLCVKNQAA